MPRTIAERGQANQTVRAALLVCRLAGALAGALALASARASDSARTPVTVALSAASPVTTAQSMTLQATTPQATTTNAPQRIVSLSLCVDDLLLDLVPNSRIAAVSYLAADARYSRHAERAGKLPRHHGLVEQIVALQPDLLVAAEYEQGSSVRMLRQLGYPVQVLRTPQQLADVADTVRQMAGWLGVEAQAEAQLQRWQQRLQQYRHGDAGTEPTFTSVLKSTSTSISAATSAPLAISLAPNAYTPGRHSLKNELLRWTGYRTAADVLDLPFDQELSLEQIVLLKPTHVFLEEQHGNRAAMAYQLLNHPALRQQTGQHQIAISSANWLCPGFGLADAAAQLAEARQ